MAAPVDKTKFNPAYLVAGDGIKDWWKAWGAGVKILITLILAGLLVLGGIKLWGWLFPKPPIQTNNQSVQIQPGATANITTNNIQRNDSGWEVGAFGGGLTLGSQAGVFIGGELKKKW